MTQTLMHALRTNNFSELYQILQQDKSAVESKIQDDDGMSITPLQYAAKYGFTEAMKALTAAGADVNAGASIGAGDYKTKPALCYAAEHGQLAAAQILIDAGADFFRDRDATPEIFDTVFSVLCSAIQTFHNDIVSLLLQPQYQAKLNPVVKREALLLAIRRENNEAAILLLNAGTEVNRSDYIPQGVDPLSFDKTQDSYGKYRNQTHEPIVKAAEAGNLAILKPLLDKGANPSNRHALYEAAKHGHLAVLQCLINAGAKIDSFIDSWNSIESPLQAAAIHLRNDVLRFFLLEQKDAYVITEQDKAVALAAALYHKDRVIQEGRSVTEAVEIFIKAKTRFDGKYYDEKPLESAARNGYIESMNLLFQAGADPNNQDFFHIVKLKRLVSMGEEPELLDIIHLLLSKLTDITTITTMLETAVEEGYHITALSCIQAGANVNGNAYEDKYETDRHIPICVASQNGYESIVWTLIDAWAEMKPNYMGRKPLQLALTEHHFHIAEILLLVAGSSIEDKFKLYNSDKIMMQNNVPQEVNIFEYCAIKKDIELARKLQPFCTYNHALPIPHFLEHVPDYINSETDHELADLLLGSNNVMAL